MYLFPMMFYTLLTHIKLTHSLECIYIHIVYFRELSEPVFPSEHLDTIVEYARILNYDNKMTKIKELVHTFPQVHLQVLEFLLRHLSRVASFGDVNKMQPSNLGIVFGYFYDIHYLY